MNAPDWVVQLPELESERRDYYDAMWDVLDENVTLQEMREWRSMGVRIGHS